MRQKTVRRSISMTQEMHERLALLVSKHPRDTHESDLIREAIRAYLDQQEDLIGSRKHFQKSLQDRVDRLEEALTFHMTVITYLLTALQPDREADALREAIIAAKREGETLRTQLQAVREMKASKR